MGVLFGGNNGNHMTKSLMPGIWENWSGSVQNPLLEPLILPDTIEEVQEAVKLAARQGRRTACVGAGFSWTPIFFDEGAAVMSLANMTLDTLQRRCIILPPAGCTNKHPHSAGSPCKAPRILVAAGVSFGELAKFCEQHRDELHGGYLPSAVLLEKVQVVGAMLTGSHGSSKLTGIIADCATAVTLVSGNGALVTYTDEHPHFNEARCHFGLMGITVSVVLLLHVNAQKPYVRQSFEALPARDVFGSLGSAATLKGLIERYQAVQLLWFPMNSAPLRPQCGRCSESAHASPVAAAWDPLDDSVLAVCHEPAAATPGAKVKHFTGIASALELFLMRFGTQLLKGSLALKPRHLCRRQALFGRLAVKCLQQRPRVCSLAAAVHWKRACDAVRTNIIEVCFECFPDFRNVSETFAATAELMQHYLVTHDRNPVNVVVECRFTTGSSVTMSAAWAVERPTERIFAWLQVAAYASADNRSAPFWTECVSRLLEVWGKVHHPGPMRTHWAKWGGPGGSTLVQQESVRHAYSAQISKFREAVLAADPQGVFRKDWLARIIGLKETPCKPERSLSSRRWVNYRI